MKYPAAVEAAVEAAKRDPHVVGTLFVPHEGELWVLTIPQLDSLTAAGNYAMLQHVHRDETRRLWRDLTCALVRDFWQRLTRRN